MSLMHHRYLQSLALGVVGRDNYEAYAPLFAGGILRVRLELCVLESFVNEVNRLIDADIYIHNCIYNRERICVCLFRPVYFRVLVSGDRALHQRERSVMGSSAA